MVDNVGSTPQLGGRNLNELVAKRDSQRTLVRSVSGPPATEVAPSSSEAHETDPAIKGPDTGEQISKARERRRNLESSSVSVQNAAQGANTSSQLRELTGQAIQAQAQSRPAPPPVQPEQTQSPAGVGNAPQGAPDSGQEVAAVSPRTEAPEVAPVAVGGSAGQQTNTAATETSSQAAPVAEAPNPTPTLQTSESQAPQAVGGTGPAPQASIPEVAVPNAPETSADNTSTDSSDVPEVRGDVVNVVA